MTQPDTFRRPERSPGERMFGLVLMTFGGAMALASAVGGFYYGVVVIPAGMDANWGLLTLFLVLLCFLGAAVPFATGVLFFKAGQRRRTD